MRNAILISPFLLAALLAATAPATADEQAARVEVGQDAPDVSATGIDGATYASSALEGGRPLVLVFFRGAW